jgi:hypothetical protein
MRNFRAIGRLSAIVAAAALVATPAFAAGNDPTTDPAPVKQERTAPQAAKAPKASQQYCVQDEITGSRMPRKVCKTRAEWIAEEGFDPLSQR